VSINWGPWSEVGGARWERPLEEWERKGVGAIDPERGFAVLEHLLGGAPPQVAVLPIEWARLAQIWTQAAGAPILSSLIGAEPERSSAPGQTADEPILETLKRAPAEGRQSLLVDYVGSVIARVLCVESGTIDTAAPLNQLGMDSLMALQVKHRVELELGVGVPVVELLRGAPVEELCRTLDPLLLARAAAPGEVAAETAASGVPPAGGASANAAPAAGPDGGIGASEAAHLLDRVEELSDEEVRAQLGRLLG
jgi:hypothetical protein